MRQPPPQSKALPSISIVTPSYNQGRFLEQTLRSVLDQGYEPLEYVVIDGGSTDGSPAVIERYADRLSGWVSKPDNGQYDAINKGFAQTSGEVMAWLNSDDIYFPWTFSLVAEIFAAFPQVEWLTSALPMVCNPSGQVYQCTPLRGFHPRAFRRGANMCGAWGNDFHGYIQQESTFWRRSLWERAGGQLNPAFVLAGDYELWARFFDHAELYAVNAPLAAFRRQATQKTTLHLDQYLREAEFVHRRRGDRPAGPAGALFRRLVRKAIGPRQLYQAPRWLRGCVKSLPGCLPGRLIVWRQDRWQIVEDVLV